MVHQHFMLVPVMTVAENLVLGTEPSRGLLLDYREAVRRARELRPDLPIEVEVRDPREIDEALAAGAPRLLLDNMTPAAVAAAVARVGGRAELEASGGVTPETVVVYSTINGLDYVSMGALTHSAPNLDLSLILEIPT
jgi:nicotinate-nucleotide pyrophosphorylase (carboxylating)